MPLWVLFYDLIDSFIEYLIELTIIYLLSSSKSHHNTPFRANFNHIPARLPKVKHHAKSRFLAQHQAKSSISHQTEGGMGQHRSHTATSHDMAGLTICGANFQKKYKKKN